MPDNNDDLQNRLVALEQQLGLTTRNDNTIQANTNTNTNTNINWRALYKWLESEVEEMIFDPQAPQYLKLPSRAGKGANYSPLFLRQLTSSQELLVQQDPEAARLQMAGDTSPINIRYLHPRPNTISSLKTAHTPCFAVVVQAVVKSKFYTNA